MKHPHAHIPLLIFAVSVTVFVFALYGYMFRTVNVSLGHALAARDAVAKEQSLKAQELKLTELYEKTTADRQRLVSLFVSDSETINFIEMIEALGQQAGSEVTISSLESDNLEGMPAGTLGHIRLKVSVTGSWTAVMRTLKLAEVLPYKVSISNIGFSMGGGNAEAATAKNTWQGTFAIEAITIHMDQK